MGTPDARDQGRGRQRTVFLAPERRPRSRSNRPAVADKETEEGKMKTQNPRADWRRGFWRRPKPAREPRKWIEAYEHEAAESTILG